MNFEVLRIFIVNRFSVLAGARRFLRGLAMAALVGVAVFAASCNRMMSSGVWVVAKEGGEVTSGAADAGHHTRHAQASLFLPPDALPEDTGISIERVEAPASTTEDVAPIDAAFKFGPSGLHFIETPTLQICYDPAMLEGLGAAEEYLSLFHVDPETGIYSDIGGVVDTQNHCVSGEVEHFSYYSVALTLTQNRPIVGRPITFPSVPFENHALLVRSIVKSHQATGGGAIAVVVLYHRNNPSSPFTPILMQPQRDFANRLERYYAVIPAASVQPGLEYYIMVTDNLNQSKKQPLGPGNYIIPTVEAVEYYRAVPATVDVTVDFTRKVSLQGCNSGGTCRNILHNHWGEYSVIDYYEHEPKQFRQVGSRFYLSSSYYYNFEEYFSDTLVTGGRIGRQNMLLNPEKFSTNPYEVITVTVPVSVHAGKLHRLQFYDGASNIIKKLSLIKRTSRLVDIAGFDKRNNYIPVAPKLAVYEAWPSSGVPKPGLSSLGEINPLNGVFTAFDSPGAAYLTATLGPDPFNNFEHTIKINILDEPVIGNFTVNLPSGRIWHTATKLIDGDIRIFGGYFGLAKVEENVIIEQSLVNSVDNNFPVVNHTVTQLKSHPNQDLLVVGEFSSHFFYDSSPFATIRYLLTSNQYRNTFGLVSSDYSFYSDSLPGHTATSIPGMDYDRILIAGSCLRKAFVFNYFTGHSTVNMQKSRAYHTATLMLNNTVLITGGLTLSQIPTPGSMCDFSDNILSGEVFNINNLNNGILGDEFSVTDATTYPRAFHSATLLENGDVLIVGHADCATSVPGEIYDVHQAPHSYVEINNLLEMGIEKNKLTGSICHHQAILDPNTGWVYFFGGLNGNTGSVGNIEVYYPEDKVFWNLSQGLAVPRYGHTATVRDGKIYIVGGYNSIQNDYPLEIETITLPAP